MSVKRLGNGQSFFSFVCLFVCLFVCFVHFFQCLGRLAVFRSVQSDFESHHDLNCINHLIYALLTSTYQNISKQAIPTSIMKETLWVNTIFYSLEMYVEKYIFTQPLSMNRKRHRVLIKQIKSNLNSEFSFSYCGCLTKVKESCVL